MNYTQFCICYLTLQQNPETRKGVNDPFAWPGESPTILQLHLLLWCRLWLRCQNHYLPLLCHQTNMTGTQSKTYTRRRTMEFPLSCSWFRHFSVAFLRRLCPSLIQLCICLSSAATSILVKPLAFSLSPHYLTSCLAHLMPSYIHHPIISSSLRLAPTPQYFIPTPSPIHSLSISLLYIYIYISIYLPNLSFSLLSLSLTLCLSIFI